ncbi:hypothetical protein AOQ84DRAFT_11217 [Glonium stellatum]|uniref:Uncharacterized protein n=1 Tax=Glonium stellatum TaxID=574774 RepID=A0A8E2JZB2_9PEZI|nr:hypothetical protein AOQ84DRAFT_11217 [Glonium stellatum]
MGFVSNSDASCEQDLDVRHKMSWRTCFERSNRGGGQSTIVTTDLAKSGYKFYIHVDQYDTNELPESKEGLSKWLEEGCTKEGQRLETLKASLHVEMTGKRRMQRVNEEMKAKACPTHHN